MFTRGARNVLFKAVLNVGTAELWDLRDACGGNQPDLTRLTLIDALHMQRHRFPVEIEPNKVVDIGRQAIGPVAVWRVTQLAELKAGIAVE